jgi:hypothetical protein
MAMANMVVEGTSVTASQLKELFGQIDAGIINRKIIQAVLERRNPFESIIEIDPTLPIIENLAKLDKRRRHEDWHGWDVARQHTIKGYPFSERVHKIDLEHVRFVKKDPTISGTGPENVVLLRDRVNFMASLGQQMLDANCLIAILKNQHLIPPRWAENWGRMVFFCGTILKSPQGGEFALDITYDKGEWWLNRTSLKRAFNDDLVIAVYD